MADIYAERGDWQNYLECSEWSLNWILQNRDNRALNVGGPPTPTYYLVRVGIGLNKTGQKAAGEADVDEGIKQLNQQLATHANHGEDVIYAGDLLNPASDFYVEVGQISKAVTIWDNYIAMVDPFVKRNPEDTSSLGYLAYAYERKGDCLSIYQKERDAFAQTNIASLRTALTSYQTAIEHRRRILQLDPTNQSHIEAENALTLKISRLTERFK